MSMKTINVTMRLQKQDLAVKLHSNPPREPNDNGKSYIFNNHLYMFDVCNDAQRGTVSPCLEVSV